MTILQGNSCSIAQKSGEIYTAQLNLQPIPFKTDRLLATLAEIRIGALEISKPLMLWIDGGLMAILFFLGGPEFKRELIEGELSDSRNITPPGVGVIGGMAVPALINLYFNFGDSVELVPRDRVPNSLS